MEYLTDDCLANLKLYKYSSIDKSPLSKYVLNPYYWTPLSNMLPVWLHANLVTLLGFLAIIIVLIITYVVDGLDGRYQWLSFLSAAAIWYYSTMDNLDGKQARRTKTSSPLGELVDHGCDALQCCFGGLVQAAGMGLGYSYYTLLVVAIASVPFYFSSWEEYYTKTLYLGYVNGPTEGLLLGSICGLVSAIWGRDVYFTEMSYIHKNQQFLATLLYPFEQGTISALGYFQIEKDLVVLDVLVFLMGLAVFANHVPACIFNVYSHPNRKEHFLSCLFKTYPIFLFVTSGVLISQTDFFWNKEVFWVIAVGSTLSFGIYTTQVILAYIVSRQYPSPSALWSLFALSLYIRYSNDSYYNLFVITKLYTSFFVIYYISFLDSVFSRFCSHLNMSWYKVPIENQKLLSSSKSK